MESPYQRFLHQVRVSQEKRTHALAFCPAHEDRNDPSLSVKEGRDGRVLLKCFAGCSVVDIVAAVDLKMRDLYPFTPGTYTPKVKPKATSAALKETYRNALASILRNRSATESDAPISTSDINRARAVAEFAFRNVTLAPRAPKAWEVRPPWDRDPVWPIWYEATLRTLMLARWAKEHPTPIPGETDPAGPTPEELAAAATQTAAAMRDWATKIRRDRDRLAPHHCRQHPLPGIITERT